jgi:hypothetical protein
MVVAEPESHPETNVETSKAELRRVILRPRGISIS